MKKYGFILLCLIFFLVNSFSAPAAGQTAPDFPENLEWLNVDRPLGLRDLRGKVVLLDFWTYCCINCQHIIPDLKKLEEKYRDELVVIGIHSAKFTNEKETQNIREAVMRHEIGHPVVNDKYMQIWEAYDVHAWPTLILVDPAGQIAGGISGEEVYKPLDESIGRLAADFGRRGLLNRKPFKLSLEKNQVKEGALSFPGKVLTDEASKRLFISDSSHNRIVVASLEGEVREVIGSGDFGFKDGNFKTAVFRHPQGMALDGNYL